MVTASGLEGEPGGIFYGRRRVSRGHPSGPDSAIGNLGRVYEQQVMRFVRILGEMAGA